MNGMVQWAAIKFSSVSMSNDVTNTVVGSVSLSAGILFTIHFLQEIGDASHDSRKMKERK